MEKKKKSEKLNFLDEFAVCNKDIFGKVLFQNKECESICGQHLGEICTEGCMYHHNKVNVRDSMGTFQFKNVNIQENDYDILMINDGHSILSLLYNLSKKKKEDLSFFNKFRLTPRELSIITLVSQGLSNQQIANKLYISPKTLKTHINNILRKIPHKYWPR